MPRIGVALVFRHAVLAHGHVAGQQSPDLGLHAGLIHAKRVGDVVPHRVHGVVRHVAVQGPVTGHRNELQVASLTNADDLCDLAAPLRSWPTSAIAAGDLEARPMHVDRVIPHGQIADANAHALTRARNKGFDGRKHLAVEGPQIEVLHDGRVGAIGTRMQRPVVQQYGVVAVDGFRLATVRMNDEHAHHAYSQLHHLICVRVVHVRAVLTQRELVGEGFAGLDMRL